MTDFNDPSKEPGHAQDKKSADTTNTKPQEEQKEQLELKEEKSPPAADNEPHGDGNHSFGASNGVKKPEEDNTKSTDAKSSKEVKSIESGRSAPPRDRQYAKDLLLAALLVFILASFIASNLPDEWLK